MAVEKSCFMWNWSKRCAFLRQCIVKGSVCPVIFQYKTFFSQVRTGHWEHQCCAQFWPCQIITPLVLVGLGLGVGEGLGLGVGLGLGNHIAISTRGVIIWQGVENGHNTRTFLGGLTADLARCPVFFYYYLYIFLLSQCAKVIISDCGIP